MNDITLHYFVIVILILRKNATNLCNDLIASKVSFRNKAENSRKNFDRSINKKVIKSRKVQIHVLGLDFSISHKIQKSVFSLNIF